MPPFSRRTMIGGAVAATAAGSVGSALVTSTALSQDASATRLGLFVGMSAALTGISKQKLSPDTDPINIKQVYFDRAKSDPLFDHLLQIFKDNQANPTTAADIILNQGGSNARRRFVARSIMLAWYLGAWYDPDTLQRYSRPNPPTEPIPFEVISPTAYTQAWIWRVAQAHPMGYSEEVFGYWSTNPPNLSEFI